MAVGVQKSSGSHQAVVRQLSGQSSGSRQAVVKQSSGSHQAVVRKSPGSCQAVVRQSSVESTDIGLAVIRKLLYRFEIVIT